MLKNSMMNSKQRFIKLVAICSCVALVARSRRVAAFLVYIACVMASLYASNASATPITLDNLYDARCKTAICLGTGWRAGGFEIFADLPIGGAWLLNAEDKHGISGLPAANQIEKQFNRNMSLSFQGGARVFLLKGLFSVGFGFSAYKSASFSLERYTTEYKNENITIGSNGVTASPVIYFGLIEDLIAITWMRVSYSNDGPGHDFGGNVRIDRDATVATGHVFTLGIAPVAAFRSILGVATK
jgi:hypothetical protein